MSKTSVVKGLIICGSVTGAGCSVVIPLSTLNGGQNGLKNLSKVSGGGSQICKFFSQSQEGGAMLNKQVNFDELGTGMSIQLNSKDTCQDISGKEDLKKVFSSTLEENQFEWKVIREEDKEISLRNKKFGYGDLDSTKTRKSTLGKLFIEKDIHDGKIKVLKSFDNDNTPSFYKCDSSSRQCNGIKENNVSWNQLSGFSEVDNSDYGSKIDGFSTL